MLDDVAERLRTAYRTGSVPPLRDALTPVGADGASMVQGINTRIWRDAGRRIVGRKVGLTAKAVQAQLGLSELATLPRSLGDGIAGLRGLDPPEPPPERELWLGFHEDLRHTVRVRTLFSHIAAEMQA